MTAFRLGLFKTAGSGPLQSSAVFKQKPGLCIEHLLPVLLLAGINISSALAAPEGFRVTQGKGSFSQAGNLTTIRQGSQNLATTWSSFNIAADETVRFVQPSVSSLAVNRILDANASQIMGRLSSNGQIYLINQNGMLFGATAQVDVGGLVASTLNPGNDAADGNRRSFRGNATGTIVNQGSIRALAEEGKGGYVALIGRQVDNQGTITAPMGAVVLAGGNAVTLTFNGNNLIALEVDESVVNTLVQNGGLIQADGGRVWMTAGAKDSLAGSLVSNTGIVEARTMENRNGAIVLLGGMENGAVQLAGTLDASAPKGGNGGFIETSAASVRIAPTAIVTTAARYGSAGNWLIDPQDYTVAASGGDITGAQLATSLNAGNVTILSTSGAAGTNGDININDVVSWSANKLTLTAQNNININSNLNGSGTASLALKYGQANVAAGNASTYNLNDGAVVNLPSGANFSTLLGSNGTLKNYTVITSLGAAGSTTGTDLQGINGNLAGNYVLGADINASATSGWNAGAGFTPLGTNAASYNGVFDGLGHAVGNLTINQPTVSYVGLFGDTILMVRNVNVVGGSMTGKMYVGGLAGLNSGTVAHTSSSASVTGTVSSTGGLIGLNSGVAILANSYATGSVNGITATGGLVGTNNGSISGSYASGTTVASDTSLGGLAGYNSGIISKSYATGAATQTGGHSYAGGLVGYNASGATVSRSYSTGKPSGTSSQIGGLIGFNGGTVSNSFWNTTTSAQSTSAGGIGLTTAQMQSQANFNSATAANGNVNPGWDMLATWVVYEGFTSPLLRYFLTPLTVTANSQTTAYSGTGYAGGNGVQYSITPNSNLLGMPGYAGNAQGATHAGTYTITPSGLYTTQQGYLISSISGLLTINPAQLTASAVISGTTSKSYDGTTSAPGASITGSIAGAVSGDVLALNGSGIALAYNNSHVATATTIAASGTAGFTIGSSTKGSVASDYVFIQPVIASVAANITPAALNASAAIGGTTTKTYDGSATAAGASVTGSIAGAVSGDVLTFDGSALALAYNSSHVANATAIAAGGTSGFTVGSSTRGSVASDYALTQPVIASVAGNITAAALSASAAIGGTTTKTYDGTTAAPGASVTGSITGGISGDVMAFDGSGLALAYNNSQVANATTIAATGVSGFAITTTTRGSVASDYVFTPPVIASVAGAIAAPAVIGTPAAQLGAVPVVPPGVSIATPVDTITAAAANIPATTPTVAVMDGDTKTVQGVLQANASKSPGNANAAALPPTMPLCPGIDLGIVDQKRRIFEARNINIDLCSTH